MEESTTLTKNTNKNYIVDRVLHWTASLVIIFMLMIMSSQVHTTDYRLKGSIAHKQEAIEIHLLMGLILLSVLIARAIWSATMLTDKQKPQFKTPRHRVIVKVTHIAMYSVLLSMMLSGAVMVMNYEHPLPVFGFLTLSDNVVTLALFTNARDIHLWMESSIYILIVGHIGAAMYGKK